MDYQRNSVWELFLVYIRRALFVLVVIFALGTIGLMYAEGWSLDKTLYMIVITVTTVGYGDVIPVTQLGRIITMGLTLFGIGTITYMITHTAELLVGDSLIISLRRRSMDKTIDKLRDHIIVCGLGRVGEQVAHQLAENKIPFVVIEQDRKRVEMCNTNNWLYITGDATLDDQLVKAGIERARGLISAVRNDTDNVFITLTARALNEKLRIVARMEHPYTEDKLRRAGANEVISPHAVGGREMVNALS
jgi:voltage-gated potassium channel